MRDAHRKVIAEWDAAADSLRDFGAEGDFARQHLLNPTIFALAGEVAGRRILDAGCGEGYLSRLLARRGALVTGVEPAARLYALCADHERREPLGIDYINCDLLDLSLPAGQFDLVIANMMLMDVPDYQAAIQTLTTMARTEGYLLITLLHPCFEESGASWPHARAVRTSEYFAEYERPQGIGTLYHRPLSAYVNALLDAGLTLRRMVEPHLPDGVTHEGNDRDAHVPSFIALYAQRVAAP